MILTEQKYAKIEKKALAFTYTGDRFLDYLISLTFCMQTDHVIGTCIRNQESTNRVIFVGKEK